MLKYDRLETVMISVKVPSYYLPGRDCEEPRKPYRNQPVLAPRQEPGNSQFDSFSRYRSWP